MIPGGFGRPYFIFLLHPDQLRIVLFLVFLFFPALIHKQNQCGHDDCRYYNFLRQADLQLHERILSKLIFHFAHLTFLFPGLSKNVPFPLPFSCFHSAFHIPLRAWAYRNNNPAFQNSPDREENQPVRQSLPLPQSSSFPAAPPSG